MTSDNDNDKKTAPVDEASSQQQSINESHETAEQAGWEIREDAIDEALSEQQREIALEREKHIASLQEQQNMFAGMELESSDEDQGLPCLNCKTPLKGPYCYECGQPERHFVRFFPKVLWEMVNEALDLDSKIFRTLVPLMFRPGRLTMEYIAGRRARYVNPLRMYIVLSLVFFLVVELTTNITDESGVNVSVSQSGVKSRETVKEDPPEKLPNSSNTQSDLQAKLDELKQLRMSGTPGLDDAITTIEDQIAVLNEPLETKRSNDENVVRFDNGTIWDPQTNPIKFYNLFDEEITQGLNDYLWWLKNKAKMVEKDPASFFEEVINVLPALIFILLPIFALLLKFFYIFKKRYYMEHLVVALHSHCFIFLSLLSLEAISMLGDVATPDSFISQSLNWLFVILLIWIPINLFLQQKRIYAQGKFMTTIKFIMIGISYTTLLSITGAAAGVLGLINL